MPDFHHLVPIAATPDKVYAALATAAGLRRWWTADARADERVGGTAEFGFDRRQMVFRMTIDTLEARKTVVWRCHGDHPDWNGTTLAWAMAPGENGQTTLSFVQSGWRELTPFAIGCNTMWGHLLYRMKDALEGGNPGPRWTE